MTDSWSDIVADVVAGSAALAVGLFARSGSVLEANAGMRAVLGIDDGEAQPVSRLQAPRFAALLEMPVRDGVVFEGLITFGGLEADPGVTLPGRVTRHGDGLLIVAEHDVAEHVRLGRGLFELNQEVNNLQRAVLKEKRVLERTLVELRETQAALVQSEKMNALGQLVAGVAHEINNPVAFVHSNVYSLEGLVSSLRAALEELGSLAREVGGDAGAARAAAIREAHEVDYALEDLGELRGACLGGLLRVKKIVEDLRGFSRHDEAALKTVDLGASIETVVAIARPELAKRGVVVDLDVATAGDFRCYPAELNQVVLNLVINAAQAMERGQRLSLQARPEGAAMVITIADEGAGIPPDVLPKIFDPFFTTKPVGEGTGLGLSLAYKIVTDRHGGVIGVRSEVGAGTTFTITLPQLDAAGDGG